jgi:hypothetical protein
MSVTVNGITYLPSADGKIYGQYPLGDAPAAGALLSLAHLDNITTLDPDYIASKAYVDGLPASINNTHQIANAVYVWYISKDDSYKTLAIDWAEQWVDFEVALYPNPWAEFDSYLYVGQRMRLPALVYGLFYDDLTLAQRTKIEDYVEQALFNVYNHTIAEWGGQSSPWSGWAINNPDNNYYYSRLEGAVLWALASGNQTWIDKVIIDIQPEMSAAMANIPGGGSLEGQDYGQFQNAMMRALVYWNNGYGTRLDAAHDHTKETIDYWVHSTTPDFAFYQPFGDMALGSAPNKSAVNRYEHWLIRPAVVLSDGTPEAERGRWYVGNISPNVESSLHGELIYDLSGTSTPPTALQYHAQRLGEYFMRSDWTASALHVALHSGERSESHAFYNQGDFTIYKNGWWTRTAAAITNGIQQASIYHNIIRFERGGIPIEQLGGEANTGSVTPTVVGPDVNVVMDQSDLYNDSDVTSWVREVDFNGTTITIDDTTVHAGGVTPIFQINVDELPTVVSNVITTSKMQITVNTPISPTITVESWSSLGWSGTNEHRVSISGSSNFNITIIEAP